MDKDYYYEVENDLINAGSRSALSRVMGSVDRSRLTDDEYWDLHSFYESLWDAIHSDKKKKNLYSDFDLADFCRGGDLTED